MPTSFRHSGILFHIRRIIRTIIGLPMNVINLPAFLRERNRQCQEFSVGDSVCYRKLSDEEHRTIITVAPVAQELFHAHALGEVRPDGSRILKPPTWTPGSAEYSFFEAHEPWKIVAIQQFKLPLRFYFMGHTLTHPCALTLKNKHVPLGETIIKFVPGDLVIKA